MHAYIYGDNSSGRIWGMKHDGSRADRIVSWPIRSADLGVPGRRPGRVASVADYAGGINHLVRSPERKTLRTISRTLSQTGLFTSTNPYRMNPACSLSGECSG